MLDHLLISPKPIPMDHNLLLISKHLFQLLEELLLSEVSSSPQPQSLSLHPVLFLLFCIPMNGTTRSPQVTQISSELTSLHSYSDHCFSASLRFLQPTAQLSSSSLPHLGAPEYSFLIHKSHRIAPLLKRHSLASCDSQDNVQIPWFSP